jgi:DNA-binding transcriptional LysR family regulator
VELRQLEHFLAVVEEGSFTRAAARLFMVQSSLSASLLGLERELGTDLFIRGRRGAELTDAGRAFLEPAQAALGEADRARDAVAQVKGLIRGSVRIAAVTMPRRIDVGETIRRFQDEHPGVDVHVVPVGAQQMVELVGDGRVDFAITPRIHGMNSALRFEPLVSTPLVLICPAGHRLAGARDLDLADVVDEPIIDLPRGWVARELFDRLLEEQGEQRRVRLEINDWLAVLTMVQRGTGISYGPHDCIDKEMFTGVDTATIAGAPPWELGIVSRDDTLRGAAGRAFLAAYLEQCREHRILRGVESGLEPHGPVAPRQVS